MCQRVDDRNLRRDHLENGKQIEADVVIGADGIRSRIRAALWEDENPVVTGQIAWRALLRGKDLPTDILGSSGARAWMFAHWCGTKRKPNR